MKVPNKSTFRVGDTVMVNPGVMCPDKLTLSLSGWQGRVTEVYPEEGTLEITWDSVTLRTLPTDYIRESEQEGLGWESMVLGMNEVSPARPRDTPQAVKRVSDEIREHHRWDHLADLNPGISQLLGPLGKADMLTYLYAWEAHLGKTLQFPFEARREENHYSGPVAVGKIVNVLGIADVDDVHGLLVNVQVERRRYTLPLCDLEATDASSSNYQPLNDYVVWFANC